MLRYRLIYLGLALIAMLFGLASRSNLVNLPEFLSLYAGDVLWALMVYWLARTTYPKASILHSAAFALCFCFAIEFSQLYHAPWIDALRATRLGGLVLGFGFLLSDLICYFFGVLLGCIAETVFRYQRQKSLRAQA